MCVCGGVGGANDIPPCYNYYNKRYGSMLIKKYIELSYTKAHINQTIKVSYQEKTHYSHVFYSDLDPKINDL